MATLPNRAQPNRGSGVPIRQLRADAQALGRAEFEERHGRAFLLLSATDLAAPPPAITEVRLDGDSQPRVESTASLSLIVFAVRRNGRSASHLITLGRGADNDVVVPDVSISRFHAFVKEVGPDRWLMQDAGSTNGTTVNGQPVPRQGHGPPTELTSGDDVRLGQVELTFLDSEALASFALQLER
jgi:pSer/pThr/pTyr-binding forkhead associated (FHA) protein